MYYPQFNRYSPSVFSSASSGVSTPAMTPTPSPYVMESMLSHQPAWISQHQQHPMIGVQQLPSYQGYSPHLQQLPQHLQQQCTFTHPGPVGVSIEMLVQQVTVLQQQTNQLANTLKQMVSQPHTGQSMSSTDQGAFNEAVMVAQQVFAAHGGGQLEESSILAKAVLAAANALVQRSGGVARSATPTVMMMPQPVRTQTPAWLHQPESIYEERAVKIADSPVLLQSQESPTGKSGSPLADVLMSLGSGRHSPGTVTKCLAGKASMHQEGI